MIPADPALLRDERIQAEVAREFESEQLRYEGSLPLRPNDRQIEGASQDFAAEAWAFYQLRMAEQSAPRCPVCKRKLRKRKRGANGRPRVYDRRSCQAKAYRIRKAIAAQR